MAAIKCTCPECKATFTPRTGVGPVKCPSCKAKITLGSANGKRSRVDVDEEPASSGGSSTLAVVGIFAFLLFLLVGAGLALFVFKSAFNFGGKGGDASVAHKEDPKPSDPSTVSPDVIERPGTTPSGTPDPVERPTGPKRPDPEPVDPKQQKQLKINAAIDKGIEFLRKDLERVVAADVPNLAPYREGYAAFMGLTLLECGVPADDPLIQKTAALIAERMAQPPIFKTYNHAASVLFLEKLGDKKYAPLFQALTVRLLVGQLPNGMWKYDLDMINPVEQKLVLDYLAAVDRRVNFALPGAKDTSGLARRLPLNAQKVASVRWLNGVKLLPNEVNGADTPFSGDNSNTQFAMLALWAAARTGLPTRAAMGLGAQYFASIQAPDGGWSYHARTGSGFRASMTCAGLLGVGLGRGVGRKPDDRNLAKGFKFLSTIFDGGAHKSAQTILPGQHTGKIIDADAADDLYYLWSLERVCLIFGVKTIRDRDWYDWESDLLLAAQKPDGSWEDYNAPAAGTCFALLILKRVNVVRDLKVEENIKKEVDRAVNIKD